MGSDKGLEGSIGIQDLDDLLAQFIMVESIKIIGQLPPLNR